ncbi:MULTISPECIES: anthranilate synthase component II [Rheinheimera]|jgi:anthranilate synthase/aminodeoxychorismate synthase-like glutamine amidotransferase|uniref:Aminodeoxychorismate/anthranilate synthase component II n=1 Tax=Rheinheimera tangshanensis TaxID=400153 RepID=A0A5C8M1E0_9GAMM|nr:MULTISPECIES: aminodeoxychorismate/anthranilate synthase component II [Rheinheimera]TXK81200.1 aminodeoxychorismate/anthranilate synthase component II [Rheinheimera tangshanensis]GGM58878.1 glutamine amidotransferase [Rheinheimera tangshanensis]
MILLIDNYDSFTYNLVQYFAELGEQVLVRRNDEISLTQIAAIRPSSLVISPGPCSPDQAGISLAAIEHFAGQMPILGVCLGHQAIAQVFGAKVVRARAVMHGKNSLIKHRQRDLFQGLNNPLSVTRYHSLIVEQESLPDELSIEAWTAADEAEIMALSHKKLPLYGVQFHPEAILTEQGHQLLQNFLTLCKGLNNNDK